MLVFGASVNEIDIEVSYAFFVAAHGNGNIICDSNRPPAVNVNRSVFQGQLLLPCPVIFPGSLQIGAFDSSWLFSAKSAADCSRYPIYGSPLGIST